MTLKLALHLSLCNGASYHGMTCRSLDVAGVRKKGRGKKTWMDCVSEDMKKVGLKREDAQNRSTWSAGKNRRKTVDITYLLLVCIVVV